ncbi:hypothetical protein LCGC14_0142390 [marine sediment metagenome]|uniref:Uncharacterized protein n=1 Tax=marine sediment metagenome TaxID=412755 RepID=A0A0F9V4S8_9ZZZZ
MSKLINLVGQKFGKLLVLRHLKKDKYGNHEWLCRCDCGQEKIIRGDYLKSGHTQSCGCLQKKMTSMKNTIHGHNKNGQSSKTYMIWAAIIQRCTNPSNGNYLYYGGRGITVCKRWRKFENFLKDMGEAPKGLQIDRINNDKGYCKSNCRWATRKEQARNTRTNHLITCFGKTQCITAWAEEIGIHVNTIYWRLNHGWSIEKALMTPVRKHKKRRK